MKILGIDTSTHSTSVCIIEDEKLICEYTVNTKKTHSQKLMVMIESMIKESDLNIKDIDSIAICIGPGSFTGLRISMATAKAIAQVRNLPIIAVNSLESLAFNMNLCDKIICPILDAQRNQVYTGKYKFENGEFKTIEDIKVIEIEALIEELSNKNEDFILVGEATILYKEKLNGEFEYSLQPNIYIIISSLFSIVSDIFLINGAEGVYARDISQPIFGI